MASPLAVPDTPKRVLIVLLGSIGDVVRALPLLHRIRLAWPYAHLAWAVEPKSEPLLRGHRWLDELIVYDRTHAPWSFASFLLQVRRGGFDLVIDLQRHLKSGAIGRISGAPERLGFAPGNTKEFNHLFSTRKIELQPKMRLKLAQYQVFGDALGIPPAAVEFGLEQPPAEAAKARSLLAAAPYPRVAVVMGSSWPSRVYPAAAVAAVVRELAQSEGDHPSLFPVLIGGSDEVEFAAEVARGFERGALLNLTGKTGLRDLITIFAECSAAFGPDSGPMHIAAAVRCPIVSLWGATAPGRSAPWGYAEFAIRGEIPCHPCYLRRCPIGGECMRRISPQTVVREVRRALAVFAGDPSRPDYAAPRAPEKVA
jgi:heptosyltransferase I